jgi:serine/threonine protein kinase
MIASDPCHFWHPPPVQDLISRLLERKPAKRLGMLNGRANDVKQHKWFEGMSWEELEARRVIPQRKPKESDSSKRLKVRDERVRTDSSSIGPAVQGQGP